MTAAPLVSNDMAYLSLGINGLFEVTDFRWSRFFTYWGMSGAYNRDSWSTRYSTSLGGGFGMEFIAFDHFGFDLMGGLRGYLGQEYSGTVYGTGVTAEGGIFYRL